MSFTHKTKKLFTRWRFIFLAIMLLFALLLISPHPWREGVAISGVTQGSPAFAAGIFVSEKGVSPINREVIHFVNSVEIKSVADYYAAISNVNINDSVFIETSKSSYALTATEKDLGIRVTQAPKSNIRMGLDLQGGTRILLEPENKISNDDFTTLQENIERRLNLFGLSDIRVSIINDQPVGGNPQYLLVEIAGVGIEEVETLISRQGKFEAKIANQSVFLGSDIKSVSSDARAGAGVDSRTCGAASQGGYSCQFHFPITLSLEAAQNQANITKNLDIITENSQRYLSQKLDLYLDDQLTDSLSIGADLKGRALTDIQISGGGSGATLDDAIANAVANMKELQTVLKTGGLPSKLDIVRADTISASLGDSFIGNSFFVGLMIFVSITAVIYLRYRSWKITLPMVFLSFAEVVLLFGFAALVGWNIDLAAIAGIIVLLGSGIDHLVIIIDEIQSGESKHESWVARIKSAFTIILIAYFTTVVAMLPLLFAGAGILKGFALTTIAGVTLGIIVTRPAYGAIAEVLHNDN